MPLFLRKDGFLGEHLYLKKLVDILNLGHSLVLYNVSSDGKNLQVGDSTVIENPLRIEDDIIAKKQFLSYFLTQKL